VRRALGEHHHQTPDPSSTNPERGSQMAYAEAGVDGSAMRATNHHQPEREGVRMRKWSTSEEEVRGADNVTDEAGDVVYEARHVAYELRVFYQRQPKLTAFDQRHLRVCE